MTKTRVTIIGLGNTGCALAAALRPALKNAEFIGHDKDLGIMREAERQKLINKSAINLFSALEDAALVLLCIPLNELTQTLGIIGKDAPAGAIFVDTAASKAAALRAAASLQDDVTYISSSLIFNPNVAQTHATPRPTKGAVWAFTPRAGSSEQHISQISNLALAIEATPIFIDVAEHDGLNMAARVLPAVVASALFAAVSRDEAWRERKWLASDALAQASAGLEGLNAEALAAALMEDKVSTTHWLNQTMLQLMALRDAVNADDAKQLIAELFLSHTAHEKWLDDWQRGRESAQESANESLPQVQKPSMMGALLGDRLASTLTRGGRKDR